MTDDQYYTVGVDMISECGLRGYAYVPGDDPDADGRRLRLQRRARVSAPSSTEGPSPLPPGGRGSRQHRRRRDIAKRFFSSFKAAD